MPRDGSTGAYALPSGNPVVNATIIDATVHNTTNTDIATALSNSVAKDGQTTMTSNLPMGGNKLTNVAAGSAANQSPIISQIQDGSLLILGSVSGTDTIAAALSPAITSYAAGMHFIFTPANANTGAVTIAINGLAAKAITKGNAAALVANDLLTTIPAVILYDGTRFVLLNPAGTLPAANGSALTNLNASNLASGTVPDARFPATLPAVSGANLTALPATLPASSGVNLTALNASNLGSGTVPDARFPATLPAVSGANLTALNGSNLASGTVPDARFPSTLPAVSGANLTALNAANLGSGSIPDARVQASNVAQHVAKNISAKTGTVKTLSTSAPSGGSDGDIWYRY